ncbi:uroporphyrinogen-III C-methyltransferase [Methylomonas paludis]|uniref:Siroheme synthase n=1 Tax=Methylomonas paludis TaxID=1173101 RepID=A0A975MQL0_9GAMM|nr:siroheme synthase CysG [Methylomonas paludis]QWF71711.1 uroporphyrinogen-III C-methyltransferase [Methylomonas paludis]
MDYFPLFLDLKQKNCLVVGAGPVAARKIEALAGAGAQIRVVAPQISTAVTDLQNRYNLDIQQKTFEAVDLTGIFLVVCATDQHELNKAIAAAAQQAGLLVNVVDNPALCNFIFPAIVDRSPLLIAITSGGAAPVLTRLLRAKIETVIPAAYGKLAEFAEKFRPLVKQNLKSAPQRRIFWENTLQGNIAEQVFTGNQTQAEALLRESLAVDPQPTADGEVYLIGAGPGDPDLLTFRALRLMQQADVIVYDRLVSAEIMNLARRDSEKIYVGKERNNHSLPQESINALLITLAQAGKRVARLKGGDPFIFGRGGEEIETLMQQGIRFQVVPGITAASGCASYAGIPLTHRDHAQACLFVTGHLRDGSIINQNWPQLAAPNQTVVIYMGLVGLEIICRQLIAHGCAAGHPIAVIQQGTTKDQRIIIGTLTDMPERVTQAGLKAPTLIIVGSVVTLHKQLAWFHP